MGTKHPTSSQSKGSTHAWVCVWSHWHAPFPLKVDKPQKFSFVEKRSFQPRWNWSRRCWCGLLSTDLLCLPQAVSLDAPFSLDLEGQFGRDPKTSTNNKISRKTRFFEMWFCSIIPFVKRSDWNCELFFLIVSWAAVQTQLLASLATITTTFNCNHGHAFGPPLWSSREAHCNFLPVYFLIFQTQIQTS